jgi:hypothetical protein
MPTIPTLGRPEASPVSAPVTHSLCPVCGGPLLFQGWQLRCSRCQFSLCEGCEGGPVEVPEVVD